jgi:hypothetical protein
MDRILETIRIERKRQDKRWGGPENDDQKTFEDWVEHIAGFATWANELFKMHKRDEAKRKIMQTAALCVACLESLLRAETVAYPEPPDVQEEKESVIETEYLRRIQKKLNKLLSEMEDE